MTEAEIMGIIKETLEDVLDRDDLLIDTSTTADEVPGWDSLSHINLMVALEREFGIKFALGELQDLKNVGEMAALIRKKTH